MSNSGPGLPKDMIARQRREQAQPNPDVTTSVFQKDRLINSINGNPRWRLHTTRGTWNTEPDSQAGIDAGNLLPGGSPQTIKLWIGSRGVWKIETM